MGSTQEKTAEAMQEIHSDPYLFALAKTESDLNPQAHNPTSSAAGLFQLTKATQKALAVKDPFDVPESLGATKRLTAENAARFGDDPEDLYAAHYLGATLYNKVLKDKPLSDDDQALVRSFYDIALPRFQRAYATAPEEAVQA